MNTLLTQLTQKTKLSKEHIKNILNLLEEGATIPFIARYRKEMTGSATDETLRDFETVYESSKKLLDRKETVQHLLKEKGVLTALIQQNIEKAETLGGVEAIYHPFKEKKNSKATVAMGKGLKPLAYLLQKAELSKENFHKQARNYVKNGIKTVEEAIQGAQDIVAEQYADNSKEREYIHNTMLRFGVLEVKKTKTFDENGVFKNYIQHTEKIAYIPSHRYLAIMRGVSEKQLSVKITIDVERIHTNILHYKIPKGAGSCKAYLFDAYKEGLKRLLLPSVQRAVHAELKEKADLEAINTFGKNLHQLLMTPPVVKRIILGVDPAFTSGCKLAVIDANGHYLDHAVIYPTQPRNEYEKSKKVVLDLVEKYGINAVAIGNGTGSQETQAFFATINQEQRKVLQYTVVSEAGASVYSASKIATFEYPKLDVTIRGAISIAQRLRDPMATLVKIDPKSLGIGQYQHDVDQKLLNKKLGNVTQDLVNNVGVDVNSASASLLSYVAGIGNKIAQNIIDYRDSFGDFRAKNELLKVKGLGAKAYEQAAGFIRIKGGNSVFDNTGIHPESYGVAKALQEQKYPSIKDLCTDMKVGEITVLDIQKELEKPGFDPREDLPSIPFKEGLTDIKMLKVGSTLSGVVRNITDFGAFVDIGLKNDGMIHISKMSEKRIKHPLEILALNQYLPILEVISIDTPKQKVGLSLI